MIAALLLLASQLGSAPGAVPAGPPVDWAAMPALRYASRPELPAGLDELLRAEVAAGRCGVAHEAKSVRVELAVLVDAGMALRIVPRAIGCPTVEQFAAGLMSRIVRDHLDATSRNGWYRATLDVAWRG